MDRPLLLAVIAEDDSSSRDAMFSTVPALKDSFVLGITPDIEVLSTLLASTNAGTPDSPPLVVAYNPLDETRPILRPRSSSLDASLFRDFATRVSSPVIGRLDLPSFGAYIEASRHTLLLSLPPSTSRYQDLRV